MRLKPFNQTFVCRLIIGRLIGKGETTMEPQLKVCYEALAAMSVVAGLYALMALIDTLYALLPAEKSILELAFLMSVTNLIGAFWLGWYMLVQFIGLVLPLGDTEIGVVATLLIGLLVSLIFQSRSFADWSASASQDTIAEAKVIFLTCYILPTWLPTYSVWQAQK